MTNPDPMKCECRRWCREWKPGDLREDGQRVLTHHPGCAEVGYCVHKYRRDMETCPYCELIEADAEVKRLRAALKRYGQHQSPCPWAQLFLPDKGPCTCGLAEALKGAE